MGHPFNSLLNSLTDPQKWRRKRQEALDMARRTREALTRPDGYWCYSLDDPRVAAGVRYWVDRARRAHAIALGREPLMRNVIISEDDKFQQGQLFVRNV